MFSEYFIHMQNVYRILFECKIAENANITWYTFVTLACLEKLFCWIKIMTHFDSERDHDNWKIIFTH